MVELITAQVAPSVRGAGQVSNAPAENLARLGGALQGTANNFSQYYEEKAATERELTMAQAQSDWSRTYAERARSAGSGFTEGMMADYDAYVATAMENYGAGQPGNIGQRGREQLQTGFAKYRLNLEEKALQREAAARAAAAASARAETDRLRANALISDPSLLDEYLEGANPAQRSLYIRSAMSAEVRNDPEAVREAVLGGRWDADLTPDQKLSFLRQSESGIEQMEREVEVTLNQERRDFSTQMDEDAAFAMANGAPPATTVVTLARLEELYPPAEAQEIWGQWQQTTALAHDVHVISTSTPSEISFTTSELQAAVEKPGHTQADVQRLNTYMSALNMRNEAITEDAAGYVIGSSASVQTRLTSYGSAQGAARNVTAESYINALEFEYNRLGVPDALRTWLPDNMAQSVVQSFQDMGADMVPLALRDFRQQWGDAGPAIIEQLAREGLAPEYVEAMRYSDNPALSASIAALAGITDTELRKDLITGDVTVMTQDFQSALAEYRQVFEAGGNASAATIFNRTSGVAERLILSQMRRGVDSGTAVANIMDQMFPETPLRTSSAQVLLPQGVSEFQATSSIEAAQESLTGVVPLIHDAMPAFASEAVSYQALRDRGVWLNNSDGSGVVLHYNIGGYLLPAEVEGGGFYEVKFTDMSQVPSGNAVSRTARVISGAFGLGN